MIVAQEKSHRRCQSIPIHGEKGCRDPRCSLACHHRYGMKRFWVTDLFFSRLPQEYTRLYASVKMPVDATLKEHAKARSALFRNIRRYEQKTGEVLRVLLITHPTAVDQLHYDLIAYSTLSESKARKVLKEAWIGSSFSLTRMRDEKAALMYAFKANKRQEHEYRFLLARRNGINQVYGTRSFYKGTQIIKLCSDDPDTLGLWIRKAGTSVETLWSDWRTMRYGDKELKRRTYGDAVQDTVVQSEIRKTVVQIVNGSPSTQELRQQSRLSPGLWYYMMDAMKECGVGQEYGRWYFLGQRVADWTEDEINRFARIVCTKIATGQAAPQAWTPPTLDEMMPASRTVSYSGWSAANNNKKLYDSVPLSIPSDPPRNRVSVLRC